MFNVLSCHLLNNLSGVPHRRVELDLQAFPNRVWNEKKAAIAAGADGLLIEMHPNPCEAWCDADQALTPQALHALMNELRLLATAIGRDLSI